MRFLSLFLSILVLSSGLGLAQQRYLVTPNQEVIPLSKQQVASKIMANRLNKLRAKTTSSATAACTNQFTFGYTEEKFTPNNNFGAYHKDVMGQWYVAKASGTIDTIFWDAFGAVGAKDSIVKVRIHNSNIGPTYGPGIRPGPFDPPCQSWGYWVDVTDQDQGVAAFPEDRNPFTGTDLSSWHSTYLGTGGSPSGPPFSNEIWGLGGYEATMHTQVINHVAMLDNGIPCSLTVGQLFFINMKINAPNAHVYPDTRTEFWTAGFGVSSTDENYPARDWKFYEHDSGPSNCAGQPNANNVKRGWVARGGFATDSLSSAAYNWWYTMTVTSNTPPQVVDSDWPRNTLSTGPQLVQSEIVDCNPANPLAAGVDHAIIQWALDGVPQTPITMSPFVGDLWEGHIPGAPPGSTINFSVKAFDAQGLFEFGSPHDYRIVDLKSAYYRIDTFSTCSHLNIAGTGTLIDTSKFFSEGATPLDDGQAGPIAIPGGPMTIFGDTARYVWVGTNGAIALSKTATDTLDITSGGAYSGTWTFPNRQRNGHLDTLNTGLMPGNMIAPFYADLIYGDTTAQYGRIVYGDGGDPCQFIVEWDSLGTFDANGAIPDNSTFRVILNRCDGTIKYEYDIVGTHGQDSAALVGLQADSNSVTAGYPNGVPGYVFLNRNAYPIETKPKPGSCLKFTPGTAYYATPGWNLVSVSNTPLSMAKTDAYPGAASQAFKYKGSYQTESNLVKGRGYWLKYANRTYAGVPGYPYASVYDSVSNGWNMVGVPSKPVTVGSIVASNATVTSQYFGYSGTGYVISGTLQPARGYWVKTTTTGPDATLFLNAPAALPKETPAVETELAQMNKVTIRDAQGMQQTLYLGNEGVVKSAPMSSYEMPPSMYEVSGFDARYASGRMVETYPAQFAKETRYEYPISLQTNAYPVTVTWERASGVPAELKAVLRGQQGQLLGSLEGAVRITNSNVKTVVVTLNDKVNVPKQFALSQNYPNPFNPTTHFSVDVPHTSEVEVSVFDLLGRKITTLLAGEQPAGSITVEWDGRDVNNLSVPSGVYFVRMNVKADNFSSVRKIMLMK